MNTKALMELRQAMIEVAEETFKFDRWIHRNSCGTVACALGTGYLSNKHWDGYEYFMEHGHPDPISVERFFDISDKEYRSLFLFCDESKQDTRIRSDATIVEWLAYFDKWYKEKTGEDLYSVDARVEFFRARSTRQSGAKETTTDSTNNEATTRYQPEAYTPPVHTTANPDKEERELLHPQTMGDRTVHSQGRGVVRRQSCRPVGSRNCLGG